MTPAWFFLTLLFFASILLSGPVNRALGVNVSLCPTKSLLGIPCPLCGGTSAAFQIADGKLAGAFQTNPLAACLILGAALWMSLWLGFGIRLKSVLPDKLAAALLLLALAANWSYLLAGQG